MSNWELVGPVFMRSELAAEMYCDELLDGSGHPLPAWQGLTRVSQVIILDKLGSVSGLIRSDTPEEANGCDVPIGTPQAVVSVGPSRVEVVRHGP